MTTKQNGTSPGKRRNYDEAFKAEALRLASERSSPQSAAPPSGSSPQLRYRWQQAQAQVVAQVVAEVGSVELARIKFKRAQVRALRARWNLKRAAQELASLKKALRIFGPPTR